MRSSSVYKENSVFENRIDLLEEILQLPTCQSRRNIFSSDSFERTVFDRHYSFGHLKIIKDYFSKKHSYLYHISFTAYIATRIQFGMEADSISQNGISGRVGTF